MLSANEEVKSLNLVNNLPHTPPLYLLGNVVGEVHKTVSTFNDRYVSVLCFLTEHLLIPFIPQLPHTRSPPCLA